MNSLIKTGIALLLCTATLPAWSWYVGVGVGPELTNFRQSARISHPGDFDAVDKTHLAGHGVFGTLFTGYAIEHNSLYLALEANVNVSNNKFDSSNIEYLRDARSRTAYKMKNSFGFSLLPGYILNENTLFYGRLGYARGNFRSITSDVSLGNASERLNGFRIGLGGKQKITRIISVRMEYSHIQYQRTQFSTNITETPKYTQIRPKSDLVEFGILANFD